MGRTKKNELAVEPLRLNRGETRFLVIGHLLGQRIRRRFPSQGDAEAFRAAELAKVAPLEQVGRPLLTRFSADQLRDAEACRAMLPSWASMTDAAAFFLQHFTPVTEHAADDALALYVDEKKNQSKNRQYTVDQLEIILKTFLRDASIATTADITTTAARGWVFGAIPPDSRRAPISARTQRDRHDHLSRFSRWLISRKWLLKNPLEDVPRPEVEYGPPAILSIEQVRKILDTAWTDPAGPVMLPFFAICLLSGARPFEVRRAKEEHFFIEEDQGEPIFEVWESKTPWRTVELQEPLLGLLRHCKNSGINLAYFSKRIFDRIRRDAGVYDEWANDIQRHTYASYHYAQHRDVKWLEKSLGTSERVLFRHYIRRTVRRSDAEAFEKLTVDWSAERRPFPATTEPRTIPSR